MPRHHLAQLNVGIATAPLDSPAMAGFMNNLDRIDAFQERVPAAGRSRSCVAIVRRRCLPRGVSVR